MAMLVSQLGRADVAHPQAATRALGFYEGWTGYRQPLDKFDLVAVPGKTGAMENWGLLLFDQRRLLFNQAGASGASTASAGRGVLALRCRT